MKPSGIGGQAVIEGVMMKNKNEYAVAVRKPNNEIVIEKSNYKSISESVKLFQLPILRGIIAFVDSMIIGSRTLSFSASFYEEEEEVKPSKMEKTFQKVFKEKAESVAMGLTFMLSVFLAIGIFILLPSFIANLIGSKIESHTLLAIVEGVIRIAIFISYIIAISQIKDIKRLFMYHGAEHKTINCLEQGLELTVENVKRQSKQHKRCGTSFMFIVMFVSIIFFIFIRVDNNYLRYLIRILLIPIIAGVSYEFIRLAGRSESKIVGILSKPGMWLQGLTTKEPDESMIEVAIMSVEAVFDWKEFLGMNTAKASGKSNNKKQVAQGAKAMKKEEVNKKSGNTAKKNEHSKKSNKTSKHAEGEYAATTIKTLDTKPQDIFGEEEDEILRALDRYLVEEERDSQ